jgi:hypothetical protein
MSLVTLRGPRVPMLDGFHEGDQADQDDERDRSDERAGRKSGPERRSALTVDNRSDGAANRRADDDSREDDSAQADPVDGHVPHRNAG